MKNSLKDITKTDEILVQKLINSIFGDPEQKELPEEIEELLLNSHKFDDNGVLIQEQDELFKTDDQD